MKREEIILIRDLFLAHLKFSVEPFLCDAPTGRIQCDDKGQLWQGYTNRITPSKLLKMMENDLGLFDEICAWTANRIRWKCNIVLSERAFQLSALGVPGTNRQISALREAIRS